MPAADPGRAGEKFARLVEIMARLRGPEGCPWDRRQTFESLKPYLLEETYEALDAVDRRDWPALAEELGDLLLEVAFLAQIAAEQDLFTIEHALDAIIGKLVRRHPHVFGDAVAATAEQVKQRWDQIKADERREKGRPSEGLLDSVPRALPALVEASQISSRAAAVGFDWQDADQVLEKLHEELAELAGARRCCSADRLSDELGDLLFTVVNLARFLGVDPEQALRATNAKFRRRFAWMEAKLREQGRSPAGASLEELEALWQQAKRD
ncbi:MAG: nucleoside triphosphate pyrophosphohydrolase [Bryobacterales bacterium]|nr:nucleoside triphosphate pyrophosphohydrolase [Bryobacterales bacterium]